MMRKLVSILCVVLIMATTAMAQTTTSGPVKLVTPQRPAGQKDVIELRCEPIKNVRVAVIGLGNRGIGAVYRLGFVEGATIAAICDVQPKYVERARNYIAKSKKTVKADEYTGAEDWKKICVRDDIDLVYVCTHWDLHTPIALYAMEHGKHVALEVPAALTLDDCWNLVNTAERTRRHCMMLENCNYDFFELTTLNMAQKGMFGEIVHAEGAYIHDLRGEIFAPNAYWNNWRLDHNTKETGNLYPTHGLGPIAHVMNIHRGDRMNRLATFSSNQFGMTAFAKEKFGADSPQAKVDYKHGDINTTLISTIKGKTIMIQHDVTSPRPYSRGFLVSGTKGIAQKYPAEKFAFDPNAHGFLGKQEMDSIMKIYEHPISKEVGEQAKKVGGHGGMDFIMDYRLIYCLNNGLPLDMDVYDGVEWSSLVPLSKLSLENNNMPVEFPDFTRGAWDKVKTVTYFTK